jgi:hypothetical protein
MRPGSCAHYPENLLDATGIYLILYAGFKRID